MVASLKQLFPHLPWLSYLELIDLVLQRYEANQLMDEASRACGRTMLVLHAINITTVHCPLLQIGLMAKLKVRTVPLTHISYFSLLSAAKCVLKVIRLKVLKISPQNVSDELLLLIAESELRELFIVQNSHSPANARACSRKGWEAFRKARSLVRVHLVVEANSNEHTEPIIQPNAPIHSLWLESSQSTVIYSPYDFLEDKISEFILTSAAN